MIHFIVEGGPFDVATAKLIKTEDFFIPYLDRQEGEKETAKKKAVSKTKYTCPQCDLNAWAKPDVLLSCGPCNTAMTSSFNENSSLESSPCPSRGAKAQQQGLSTSLDSREP